MRGILAVLSSFVLACPAIAEEGDWESLFDGKSLDSWTSAKGGEPGQGWQVENGVIHRVGKGGDLVSAKEFGDFELEFEWRISPKGNSGVKYRVRKTPAGWLGAEYQVIDDDGHPDAKNVDRRAAALYDLIPAAADKPLKPVGEWNQSRIVAVGTKIEHWLNGVKVVDIDTASPEWAEAKKKSKFSKVEEFAEPGSGRILLQDHGNEVWFRSIRIRPR